MGALRGWGLNLEHTLFHPSAPFGATNKGRYRYLLFVIGYKRQPVVVLLSSQGQCRPSARGDIFWHVLVIRRPSQAPRTALGAPDLAFHFNPLRICGSLSVQEPPIMWHTSHVEIIWFGVCCISQFLPLSLVSSCRSLVRVFALIDISVSSC